MLAASYPPPFARPKLACRGAFSVTQNTYETITHAHNALELRDVTKRFQKKRGEYTYALRGVSLTLKRGEVIGILGPNGSGKSTLVRVISTLTVPDSGNVRIFDVDAVAQPKIVQRFINRVSVEASFFKKMSSLENLLFGAKLYGITDRESRPRIEEILRSIGFDVKRVGEPMEHLSRGTQQKIALARALLTSPMLMLLDEPTTGLDPRSKRDVQELIWKIRASHDSSILLCTHDMGEAEELCDQIGILVDGQLIALDTPLGLKQRYQQGATQSTTLPTLEEVFMLATGQSLEDASSEKDDGDDDSSAPPAELANELIEV
jgi:ABC-2 type transport system ATP-binding protein